MLHFGREFLHVEHAHFFADQKFDHLPDHGQEGVVVDGIAGGLDGLRLAGVVAGAW